MNDTKEHRTVSIQQHLMQWEIDANRMSTDDEEESIGSVSTNEERYIHNSADLIDQEITGSTITLSFVEEQEQEVKENEEQESIHNLNDLDYVTQFLYRPVQSYPYAVRWVYGSLRARLQIFGCPYCVKHLAKKSAFRLDYNCDRYFDYDGNVVEGRSPYNCLCQDHKQQIKSCLRTHMQHAKRLISHNFYPSINGSRLLWNSYLTLTSVKRDEWLELSAPEGEATFCPCIIYYNHLLKNTIETLEKFMPNLVLSIIVSYLGEWHTVPLNQYDVALCPPAQA